MLLPEPLEGSREGAGEASVGSMGRTYCESKSASSGVPRLSIGSKATPPGP